MSNWRLAAAAAAIVGTTATAGCDASDNTIDPADLALRDLLGFDPGVAAQWSGEQRAAARDVIGDALAEPAEPMGDRLGLGIELDERVELALLELDDRRAAAKLDALALVHVRVANQVLDAEPVVVALEAAPAGAVELRISPRWARLDGGPALAARGTTVLSAMAGAAGFASGALDVVPAPRLAVAAALVDGVTPHLLVNPVLLAALEPSPGEAQADTVGGGGQAAAMIGPGAPDGGSAGVAGASTANPYSFYGSVAECAYAVRLRCEACLPASDCAAQTVDGDGNDECTAFAADAGRGYALWCVNLAVSISSVQACLRDTAPTCAFASAAAESLAALDDNAALLDDPACAGAIDACLTDLYGAPDGTFPPPTGRPPDPPRTTSIGCADRSPNCTFDPSCDVSGPSCNNSLSCDGACASSSSQGGCGGTCDSCQSSGGGGATCVSCSGSDGTGSAGDTGCGSCGSASSSSGSSCDACDSSSSGGSCGGCDNSSSDGSCGGGNGNGSCTVARPPRAPSGLIVFLQILWAFTPIPAAALVRRRARRPRRTNTSDAPAPPDEEGAS